MKNVVFKFAFYANENSQNYATNKNSTRFLAKIDF